MNEATEIEEHRDVFEEKVFNQYFMSHVTRDLKLRDGDKMLDKAKLCERDSFGAYVREDVSAMWYGWMLRALL